MKLTVTFSVDNDAFAENGPAEAARVLCEAANEMTMDPEIIPGKVIRLYDINGNRIGFMVAED